MNAKQIILAIVLCDFALFTVYVMYQYGGPIGFAELMVANGVALQVSLDLGIALTLFAIWMYRDARDRGLAFAPYVILLCTVGSIGALIYLIRRESVAQPARETLQTTPHPATA
jgi:hypothetical protein